MKKPKKRGTPFTPGDERAREAGRRGGLKSAKARRAALGLDPYEGTVLDVMDAAGLTGPSWYAWRVFLKAVFAMLMDDAELEVFRRHTERETPPCAPVSEAWMPIGRRGGKSRIASVCALYLGIRFDASQLAPGERAVIPVIAADRRQARQIMNYLKGLCALEEFRPYVFRQLVETIELTTSVDLSVATASWRTARGFTAPAACCDEVAFWMNDDTSANPDSEIIGALRPAMATVRDSLLLGLSSPYAARGELYRAVERSFGRDDPRVLVWNADTRSMNPDIPQGIIDQAFEDDPIAAASEYGRDGRVQFRRDVEQFLDPVAILAVTAVDRRELPRVPNTKYVGFVDPSGGSQDSMTLAIAHAEADTAVLDALREVRPPFSPDDVARDFAELLRSYGLTSVTGDRYGGEWPRERFREHGIQYTPSEKTKNEIYRELVAPVNAGRVQLLDLPRLRAQLIGLERRVARGGRDSIDHRPGGHDDVANAAAGALVLAISRPRHEPLPHYLSWSY